MTDQKLAPCFVPSIFALPNSPLMKILHTADWHIGKRLHKHDLSADFELFIDWLIGLVEKEEVEVLLISGDVFDLANPSSEARTAYYRALVKLQSVNCQIILTGGNHDSPAVLNAPREILKSLNIHVVGGMPADSAECLIPLKNKSEITEVVIAAIPYLRDADLRSANEEIGYESRVEAVREGIARIFRNVAEVCAEKYPDVSALAMGHLFAAGASTSDSERDIQIGNEASFEASRFGSYFKYIALGHIHRPQQVRAQVPVYYSGSPIPLSFSERADHKRVLLIDTESGFEPRSIDVPPFRRLKRISGSLHDVRSRLESLEKEGQLSTLVELEMMEDKYDPEKLSQLDNVVQSFDRPGIEIVKHRASFRVKLQGSSELYDGEQQLEDLKPEDVFHQMLAHQDFDEKTNALLGEAFQEILEQVQNPGH